MPTRRRCCNPHRGWRTPPEARSGTTSPAQRQNQARPPGQVNPRPQRWNQAVVAINGYTDDMGDEGFNLQLSKDRAAAVRSALASMGIAADRMTSDGFGENNPKVPNTSAANRAQNRRVEFVVS
ncbi:MAG: hypothetical protein CSB46_11260 [Micrococcales bacterium]|nr:MAG: hypothetical protein CSB46_11260 [Micrococcales bacterium]